MTTKFETKSDRVEGLAFHPKLPLILASLQSGVIQLWDYSTGSLLHTFDEHGHQQVRGVNFHNSLPWFVSGGDDCKIKVWDYKTEGCMFTLLGHQLCIRTVQFHHEYSWIVSASDDFTIRMWDWQSRTCLFMLNGHKDSVMCASFHPKEDLVVSASLDRTVRVWDIGTLRKKTADGIGPVSYTGLPGGVFASHKHVLKGHGRAVNWACFHPTLPLIVSAADDRQVKWWRMKGTQASVVDTLKGHTDGVSCVMFHAARQNLIVSVAEDKSVRVWDFKKRSGLAIYDREQDGFFSLALHPERNLLAAGHDGGMTVFKLESQRPAFAVSGNCLYYVKDYYLRLFDLPTRKETLVAPTKRPGWTTLTQGLRTISYSPSENAFLIGFDLDGNLYYQLHVVPKHMGRGITEQEAKGGRGLGWAVFVARSRFAVLDKRNSKVLVKNLQDEIVKTIDLPFPADAIFYAAGTDNLLCRSEDRVVLFDLQERLIIGDIQIPFVKYVVWSTDMEAVAFLGKDDIVIASKKLVHRCTLYETTRVKGGAWDDNGVFIYTTLNQMKYCLPNGDSGIIRTLDAPIYMTKVSRNVIYCLDRHGENRALAIDPTEYLIKLNRLKNEGEEGWEWELEDLEFPSDDTSDAAVSSACVTPTSGGPVRQIQKLLSAGEHAAAGDFDTAMRLLYIQWGITNLSAMEPVFLELQTGRTVTYMPSFSEAPVIVLEVQREWPEPADPTVRGTPLLFNPSELDRLLSEGYFATNLRMFSDALKVFRTVLCTIPLCVAESQEGCRRQKRLVVAAKEYVLMSQMELRRKEVVDNPVRQQELAIYIARCDLRTDHLSLALLNAMNDCYSANNFYTAAYFARALLREKEMHEQHGRAREVRDVCRMNRYRDETRLNHDFSRAFVICGATFVPIYNGEGSVACRYCSSRFVPFQRGRICVICGLASIG